MPKRTTARLNTWLAGEWGWRKNANGQYDHDLLLPRELSRLLKKTDSRIFSFVCFDRSFCLRVKFNNWFSCVLKYYCTTRNSINQSHYVIRAPIHPYISIYAKHSRPFYFWNGAAVKHNTFGPMIANFTNNRLEAEITALGPTLARNVTQTSHYAAEHTMPSCSVRPELCMHSPHIKPIRPRRAD